MRSETDLRPYQNRIATALYEHDELLCVVRPGGGKTVAALTAIGDLIHEGVIRHALVVAPKRVAHVVWPDEIAEWAHTRGLTYAVLSGTSVERRAQLLTARDRNLTIIGLDLMVWLLDELTRFPSDHPLFDLLVIDEISRLRNPKGVRSKALALRAGWWGMIWGLSGTLRPSSALDLFMPARIVTRNRLWGKSFYKWREKYFRPTDFRQYQWVPLFGSEQQLNDTIAPLTVTLAADELPQLPALSVILDKIELPSEARRTYDDMERRLVARAGKGDITAVSAAVATGKCAQLANGFMYYQDGTTYRVHGEKLAWLEDVVADATGPTLLVYEFLEDLEVIRQVLGDDVPYLGAGVSDADAARAITGWNEGKLPFMALHPASGGHGLNLQHGGSDMAWISPTWSPEFWEQTIARLHRSGQANPVIVRVCVARNTVDELKLNRVHYKMSAQDAFERFLQDYQARATPPEAVAHGG